MLVVLVQVQVKPEFAEAFAEATRANAAASLKEPGVARFDVLRVDDERQGGQDDGPVHFLLMEAYRDDEAPAAHKATAHYQTWRDTVAPMMAVPRSSVTYRAVFPDPAEW